MSARPVTLFTGQWADLPLEQVARIAQGAGYDGLELACWGDHFDVDLAANPETGKKYCDDKRRFLLGFGLQVHAISAHLLGQNVADRIGSTNLTFGAQAIRDEYNVWTQSPEGVEALKYDLTAVPPHIARKVVEEGTNHMVNAAWAAANLGVSVVNGFTGSPIWHLIYSFPPVPDKLVEAGFQRFAERWNPILNEFDKAGVRFALEVHPTEIAFDTVTAQRAVDALGGRRAFGFNFDPSHLRWQGVDYLEFIRKFQNRIYHVHMKDVFRKTRGPGGVNGSHLPFGHPDRLWDFRSPGRGQIQFEEIMRELQDAGYTGPLSVEWEDPKMDRVHGATEACRFVRNLQFPGSDHPFDKAFSEKKEG